MATGNFGNYGPTAANTAKQLLEAVRLLGRMALAFNPLQTVKPSWGSTFLGDLFARPDFKEAVLEEYYYRSAFVNSGIIQRNTALDLSRWCCGRNALLQAFRSV